MTKDFRKPYSKFALRSIIKHEAKVFSHVKKVMNVSLKLTALLRPSIAVKNNRVILNH